jgi:solute carrier family 9 (sodium/hydrogen exchanger), member 6/7
MIGLSISGYELLIKGNREFSKMMSFNDNLFFYAVLPPIVFASGFNMMRNKFFANIQNVLLFGVIGTFIAFFSFSIMTILYTKDRTMTQY